MARPTARRSSTRARVDGDAADPRSCSCRPARRSGSPASDAEEWSPAVSRDGAARVRLDAQRHAGRSTSRSADGAGVDGLRRRRRRRCRPPTCATSPGRRTAKRLAYTRGRPRTARRARRRRRHDADRLLAARRTTSIRSGRPTGTRIAVRRRRQPARRSRADGTDVRALGAGAPLDWRVVPVGTPTLPEPRAAPAERARRLAASHGRWLARLHVDGRQPRPRHPLDPRHAGTPART